MTIGRDLWPKSPSSVNTPQCSLVPGTEEERLVHIDALPVN